MEEIIKVKSSSSDEIYTIIFRIKNNLISIQCNCQAGENMMICKHRLNLLNSDISALVNESDSVAVERMIANVDQKRFDDLYVDLIKVEKEIKKLDTIKKRLKKEIGIKFSTGF